MPSRTPRSFAPSGEAVRHRTDVRRVITAADRDGREHLVGGLSETDSLTRLVLDFAVMLAIVGAALVFISWLSEGFRPAPAVVVPVEDTDVIRSDP